MTVERFEFREVSEHFILAKVYDTEKQKYANLFECVAWLNGLHEQVQSQVIVIKEYQERCDKLFEENQQLKYIIKEAYNTERTMIGKSVLKQLMERIGIE